MATWKIYNYLKLTQFYLYPIGFTPALILTKILNWIPPWPNCAWIIHYPNRGCCRQPEADLTRSRPEQNSYGPEHETCKWPELELHPNRTEPDPNMVDTNETQTRISPEADPSVVDPEVTRSKLRPNLYPIRMTRLAGLVEDDPSKENLTKLPSIIKEWV